MANEFTYKEAAHKYRVGTDLTNLTAVLFYSPARELLACAYCCYMNIDVDGDPQAYGPLNTPGIQPYDSLQDAGWRPPDDPSPKHPGNAQRKAAYEAAKKTLEELKKKKAELDPKTSDADKKDLDKKIAATQDTINSINPYPSTAKNYEKVFWDWYGLQSMTPYQARHTPQWVDHGPDPKQPPKKPKLYHPDTDIKGVDHPIQYEMYEDVYGKFPVVQVAPEPGPGYFVSQIAPIPGRGRVNSRFEEWDQRCTLEANATAIQAYGALSKTLASDASLSVGDTLLAIRLDNGDSAAFPFLDSGKGNAVAECSSTAYIRLGGTFKVGLGGMLYKADDPGPHFLYLAFPRGRTPAAVLHQISTYDNSEEFTAILSYIAKATASVRYGQVNQDPVWNYNQWKRTPENRRHLNTELNDFGDVIDVALRDNGFV